MAAKTSICAECGTTVSKRKSVLVKDETSPHIGRRVCREHEEGKKALEANEQSRVESNRTHKNAETNPINAFNEMVKAATEKTPQEHCIDIAMLIYVEMIWRDCELQEARNYVYKNLSPNDPHARVIGKDKVFELVDKVVMIMANKGEEHIDAMTMLAGNPSWCDTQRDLIYGEVKQPTAEETAALKHMSASLGLLVSEPSLPELPKEEPTNPFPETVKEDIPADLRS